MIRFDRRNPSRRGYALRLLSKACVVFVAAVPAQAVTIDSTWFGGNGNWSDPINWSPSQVPSNTAPLFLFNASIPQGTATLAENITIEDLSLVTNSSAVVGSFSLTINDTLTWMAGGFASDVNLLGNSVLSGSQDKVLNGKRIDNQGAMTISGSGRLTGTGGTLENRAGASITVNDSAGLSVSTFNNAGTYINRSTSVFGPGTFNNLPGGVLDVESGLVQLQSGANSGAMSVADGAELRFLNVYSLAAGGSVSGAGKVSSEGASTQNWSGIYNVTGTTDINFSRVNFNGTVQSVGKLIIQGNGAQANFNTGISSIESVVFIQGAGTSTFKIVGDTTVSGDLTWDGGTMTGAGTTTIQGLTTLQGVNTSRILNGRTLRLGGDTTHGRGEIFMNNGTIVNLAGSEFKALTSARVSNAGGGQSMFINQGTFTHNVLTGPTIYDVAFTNEATVNVQSGTLRLDASTSTTAGGSWSVAPGANLIFRRQTGTVTHTFAPGSSISGAGAVAFETTSNIQGAYNVTGGTTTRGTTTFSGAVANTGPLRIEANTTFSNGVASVTSLDHIAGTLSIAGNTDVAGNLLWRGGKMSGAGTTTVAGSATINPPGVFIPAPNLDARTLTVNGPTTSGTAWSLLNNAAFNTSDFTMASGSITLGAGSSFNSTGTFTVPSSSSAVGFAGAGTFSSTGALTTNRANGFGISVPFSHAGTVDVAAGQLSLGAGSSGSADFTLAENTTLSLRGTDHMFGPESSIVGGAGSTVDIVGFLTARFQGGYDMAGRLTKISNGADAIFEGPDINLHDADIEVRSGSIVVPINAFYAPIPAARLSSLNDPPEPPPLGQARRFDIRDSEGIITPEDQANKLPSLAVGLLVLTGGADLRFAPDGEGGLRTVLFVTSTEITPSSNVTFVNASMRMVGMATVREETTVTLDKTQLQIGLDANLTVEKGVTVTGTPGSDSKVIIGGTAHLAGGVDLQVPTEVQSGGTLNVDGESFMVSFSDVFNNGTASFIGDVIVGDFDNDGRADFNNVNFVADRIAGSGRIDVLSGQNSFRIANPTGPVTVGTVTVASGAGLTVTSPSPDGLHIANSTFSGNVNIMAAGGPLELSNVAIDGIGTSTLTGQGVDIDANVTNNLINYFFDARYVYREGGAPPIPVSITQSAESTRFSLPPEPGRASLARTGGIGIELVTVLGPTLPLRVDVTSFSAPGEPQIVLTPQTSGIQQAWSVETQVSYDPTTDRFQLKDVLVSAPQAFRKDSALNARAQALDQSIEFRFPSANPGGGAALTGPGSAIVGIVHGNLEILTSGAARFTSGSTLVVEGTLTNAGKIDLDGAMVLRQADADAVRAQIIQGRNTPGGGTANGKWTGEKGIASSSAAAAFTANNIETLAVGYALNSQLLTSYQQFGGVPVDPTDVLVRLTRNADANLDGIVNNNDIIVLAGFYRPGTPGRHWYQADFNYDGMVDNNDITILAGFYNPNAQALDASVTGGVVAVPEPSAALLALAAAGLTCRRRRCF